MNEEHLLKILRAPHVTEKTVRLKGLCQQYGFKVLSTATKDDIKKAIELLFSTQVKLVRVLNVKAKPKRFANIKGYSKAWKKAYVTLQEGHTIDVGMDSVAK